MKNTFIQRAAVSTVAATDVKGAAVAVEKIFKAHGFTFKVKPRKADAYLEDHLIVKGKTSLGVVAFDIYLHPNKKDVILDFWDGTGFYGFKDKVVALLDKAPMDISEGTKGRLLDKSQQLSESMAKLSEQVSDILSQAETLNGEFGEALKEIKRVMLQNPVK